MKRVETRWLDRRVDKDLTMFNSYIKTVLGEVDSPSAVEEAFKAWLE